MELPTSREASQQLGALVQIEPLVQLRWMVMFDTVQKDIQCVIIDVVP